MSTSEHLSHERWESSAAAYVLRALDADELAQFEQHLAGCAVCREQVTGFQVVADALPSAAPTVAPPPELKDRIMATVRSEAELLQAAGSDADRVGAPAKASPSRWRGWRGLTLRPATGLAALALTGAGVAIGAVTFGQGGGSHAVTRTALVNAGLAPGARASVRSSGGVTALQVAGLPAPARGRIWQVWVARPGQPPQPNVRFNLASGTVVVAGDLRGVNQLMVTEEPSAFVPTAPTGPLVLRAKPA